MRNFLLTTFLFFNYQQASFGNDLSLRLVTSQIARPANVGTDRADLRIRVSDSLLFLTEQLESYYGLEATSSDGRRGDILRLRNPALSRIRIFLSYVFANKYGVGVDGLLNPNSLVGLGRWEVRHIFRTGKRLVTNKYLDDVNDYKLPGFDHESFKKGLFTLREAFLIYESSVLGAWKEVFDNALPPSQQLQSVALQVWARLLLVNDLVLSANLDDGFDLDQGRSSLAQEFEALQQRYKNIWEAVPDEFRMFKADSESFINPLSLNNSERIQELARKTQVYVNRVNRELGDSIRNLSLLNDFRPLQQELHGLCEIILRQFYTSADVNHEIRLALKNPDQNED